MNPIHIYITKSDWSKIDSILSYGSPLITSWCAELFNGETPLALTIKKGAPNKIILGIFSFYPQAARIFDCKSELPLRICSTYGASYVVVEALLLEYPQALDHVSKISRMTERQIGLLASSKLDKACKHAISRPTSYWVGMSPNHGPTYSENTMLRRLSKLKAKLEMKRDVHISLVEKLLLLESRLDLLSGSFSSEDMKR